MLIHDGTEGALACQNHWYALRVRSRFEFIARRELRDLSVVEFLPLYTVETRWSDRVKRVERPLFPGYLFARLPPGPQAPIRGVCQIVGPVGEDEIETVRRVTEASELSVLPCSYTVGELVTVASGALTGLSGVVIKTRGAARLVVSLEVLRRAVSVVLDASNVIRAKEKEHIAAA